MARARRRAVMVLVLCAAVAVGLTTALEHRLDLSPAVGSQREVSGPESGRDSTDRAASAVPRADEGTTRLAAAHSLFSTRARAVRIKSKGLWMSTLDRPALAFRERQSVVFDHLVKLPLVGFSYGGKRLAPALRPERVRQLGPKAWATTVTGTYSLAGFDRAPQSFDATYTLVRRADGWRLAADTDGATPMQMWDLPGMKVIRGRSGIVIGNAATTRMRDYRTALDLAVRRVSGVWGVGWSTQVVILTPSTEGEFARLLSRPTGRGLDQVAAITQGVIERGRQAQADRVVINPRAFTALQPLGRQVVITHEVTHVAARSSTTSPVPIWLAEGMADYVGYSGLGLSPQRLASALFELVRAGKGPTELPAEADFDPSRTTIATSYSAAWLAVSRLADLYGQARVVAFYRAVASARTTDGVVRTDPEATTRNAFRTSFGVTQEQFVAGWRRSLRTLADARR